jgi:hypothetical protein
MQKSNTTNAAGSGFVWYAAARATTACLNRVLEVACVAGYYGEDLAENIIERIRSNSGRGRLRSIGQKRIVSAGMNYRRRKKAGEFV